MDSHSAGNTYSRNERSNVQEEGINDKVKDTEDGDNDHHYLIMYSVPYSCLVTCWKVRSRVNFKRLSSNYRISHTTTN